MAKIWAKWFYTSTQWQYTRDAYFNSKQGLCERCLAKNKIVPGDIVHHKIWLNPSNIKDPNISLNWNNLELLCKSCHTKEHQGQPCISEGLIFNENGDVVYEDENIL